MVDIKAIQEAIKYVQTGRYKRVDVTENCTVYKVPSPNPKKYTLRVDIKVEED